MLVLINTAKTFNEKKPPALSLTQPVFKKQSESLVEILKKFTPKELECLMKISNEIATLNHNRYKNWTACQALPSLFAFYGDIYKKIAVEDFSNEDWSFAQKNLLIISGLYGLLKPMDGINPYRLEMYTNLAVGEQVNLTKYWKPQLTKELELMLLAQKHESILNLASAEYTKAIELKKLAVPVVDVVFLEKTEKGEKQVAIYSKQARGLMTRYIIKNKISHPDELKAFDLEGYKFDEEKSSKNKLVFIRG